MRERRWESAEILSFDAVRTFAQHLNDLGLKVRPSDQETACYLETFSVKDVHDIDSLSSEWPLDEITLVQENPGWSGDFFVLAGKHHALYRQEVVPSGYLSLCHPWQIPEALQANRHRNEALFWVGFRETHGFIRVRVTPKEVIPPGEKREAKNKLAWMTERAVLFSAAIDVLELPLFVEWHKGRLSITAMEPDTAVSVSWPDAFGPCQFEYVVSDRYALLVPAAQLVSKMAKQPATVKTFLSGFSAEKLESFHVLQAESQMYYRGYLHACLNDMPRIVDTVRAHDGRILINLCEFETEQILPRAEKASAVIAIIGDVLGFKIEIRLNRAPLPEDKMAEWLKELAGFPVVYAPLSV